MKTKLLLFVLFACSFYSTAKAQCIADAGSNVSVCETFGVINPKVIGSALPNQSIVSYKWVANYIQQFGSNIYRYSARDFLNDTTLANPSIINNPARADSVKFFLTTTDIAGNICTNSIKSYFSNWITLLNEPHYFINLGDSVLLSGSGTFSNFPLISYLYTPNQGLRDSTSAQVWVKPIVNTKYSLKVTDSNGCSKSQTELHEVYIRPVGIQNNSNQSLKIETYPNPAVNFLTINTDEKIKSFRITDMIGRKMIQSNFSSKEIDIRSLKSGNYLIQFTMNNGSQGFGRFVKE